MDLHDSGKFKLRRHPSRGGSKGVENSRDYARPFRLDRGTRPTRRQGNFRTRPPLVPVSTLAGTRGVVPAYDAGDVLGA